MQHYNEKIIDLLQSILNNTSKSSNNYFVILEGMKYIGKSDLVDHFAQKILGKNYNFDYLKIKDLSDLIGKNHSIKVEIEKKDDKYIQVEGYGTYEDYGTREMINWLYNSPVGNKKILFIENMDRLTIHASNSLLKTFEEPINNRIIIGTVDNRYSIIDTILSRAFIIKISNYTESELFDTLKKIFPDISNDKINSAIFLSTGRLKLAQKYLENYQKESNENILDAFNEFTSLFELKGNYNKKMNILKKINEDGNITNFLFALVYYCVSKNLYEKINKIFKTNEYIKSNIKVDNALFYLILD